MKKLSIFTVLFFSLSLFIYINFNSITATNKTKIVANELQQQDDIQVKKLNADQILKVVDRVLNEKKLNRSSFNNTGSFYVSDENVLVIQKKNKLTQSNELEKFEEAFKEMKEEIGLTNFKEKSVKYSPNDLMKIQRDLVEFLYTFKDLEQIYAGINTKENKVYMEILPNHEDIKKAIVAKFKDSVEIREVKKIRIIKPI